MDDQTARFAETLRRLSVVFMRVAGEAPAGHAAFGKPDLLALGVLGVRGPSRMGDIARDLGVGQSAVTPVVDRLEAAGAVRRRRSETDRRAWLVELTETGRAAFDADSAAYARVAADMLAPLSPDDRAALIALLDRIPT